MIYYVGQENFNFPKATVEEVIEFCHMQEMLAVDTETPELHPQLADMLLFQIGTEEKQFVIDVRTEDITPFKWILENVPIVLQNAKFDLRWFAKYGIFPYLNVIDTFLAEHVIMAGLESSKDLASLCKKYLKETISKDERNLFRKKIINERTVEYAGRDIKHLIPIFRIQKKIIRKERLEECLNLELLYVPVMAYIEDCGMFIDQENWREKIDRDIFELNKSLDKLESYYFRYAKAPQGSLFGNSSMNWASIPQVLGFLKSLGLNPVDKHGKPTVGKAALKKLITEHEIIEPLLNFKGHVKNVSTYGESFLDLCNSFPDKRVRTSFRQILKTGRTGSGASEDGESTVKEANLQNIPGEEFTRHCFVPSEGNYYAIADYSQQEQNILANQSENPALFEFFNSGQGDGCLHCFIVRKMFPKLSHLTDQEIKDNHKKERNMAKTCGFAANYGGTGFTIAANLGLTKEEGERIYESYWQSFPGLPEYFDKKEQETLRQGYVLTNNIIKRRIYLKAIRELKELDKSIDWDDYRAEKAAESEKFWTYYKPLMSQRSKLKSSIRRAAMNSPVQSTGADMMKRAGIEFYHWIIENGYRGKILIANIVHDEYVIEASKEIDPKLVSDKLRECMINASIPFCDTIPMNLSIKITDKWEH